jgi:hypothetical protein
MAPLGTLVAAFLLAAAGGGNVSIADRAGDSGAAPDIRALDIGVDNNGLATFRVDVPLKSKDAAISVFIDADDDPSTGSPNDGGADYVFAFYQSDLTYYFYAWDSNLLNWAPVPDATGVKVRHDTSGVAFSVNRSKLGNASQIRVYAKSAGSQFGSLDRVPNSGMTAFELAPFTLNVAGFHAGTVKAGGQLTVTMAAKHSDTGEFASGHDTVACKLTSGGVTLPPRTDAIITLNGVPEGTCVWPVSKTFKGKTLHASITESSEGRSVTKTAAVRVG